MTILVTGAAGFIGSFVSKKLSELGDRVIGIDNLNDYYDVSLKQERLLALNNEENFTFIKEDISNFDALQIIFEQNDITKVIHLAAQAGVRYSIDNPFAYMQSNLVGHLNILECCRHQKGFKHLIYASSSSVYGGNKELPYSEEMNVDTPVSLYAATKKSDELMTQSYSHLYRMPATGLRFFTVYGPSGRPDMAYWSFSEKILKGEPIQVFNHGDMRRDFTYIDDIVEGIITCLNTPPIDDGSIYTGSSDAPHRIFNIGNNKSENLLYFIEVLEKALGKKAIKIFNDMQAGDVKETYANIDKIKKITGYQPKTSIEDGIPKFVEWFLKKKISETIKRN
jgi:UDP-glucuronate 4-epimerase